MCTTHLIGLIVDARAIRMSAACLDFIARFVHFGKFLPFQCEFGVAGHISGAEGSFYSQDLSCEPGFCLGKQR